MKWVHFKNPTYVLFSGPGVNKAVLLKIQQEREQEKSRQHVDMSLSQFNEKPTEAWDNKGYEDNEIQSERRSSRSSIEKLEKKGEVSINQF